MSSLAGGNDHENCNAAWPLDWPTIVALGKAQRVESVGQPDNLGAEIVDEYADDLMRLSDA